MAEGRRGRRGEDVAIVGMAAVFPGAPDVGAFWRNIVGGVDAISDAPGSRWDPSYYDADAWSAPVAPDRLYCRRGGFIDDLATFEPTRFGVTPATVDAVEPDQLLALRVAAEAIADAGGEDRLSDRERVGVIVGRGGHLTPGVARLDQRVRTAHQLVASLRELVPGLDDERLDRVREAFQARLGPERPEALTGLMPNLAAARIANCLDLYGPAYTVDAACASSLIAVDQATRELASGRCDTVIAGAVHHCHDVTLWSAFCPLRALSPSQRIRPFDRAADGILIGEGAGMVVLKRLVDAERDGDRVYAVIRGVGVASGGRASGLMKPQVDRQVLALVRAWRAAGLDPTEPGAIGLLEAHGTATQADDEAELVTLARVFGSPQGRASGRAGPGVAAGSVKSMIGHAMSASGIAGLLKAALAVHHGVLPPTLHCDDPHPAFARTRFRPITEAETWRPADRGARDQSREPRRAGVNAFGFGGVNAHVLLEQAPGAGVAGAGRAGTDPRMLRLAGSCVNDLVRQLQADDVVLLARNDVGPRPGRCRLAIVDPTPRSIELARRVVARGKPWRGRGDVWFAPEPLLGDGARPRAKLAFVFPGIEATFDPSVADVADHFGLPRLLLNRTGALARQSSDVTAVGRLLDAALRELAITPDLVAGHSVGEWNAMIAAELLPRDAVDEFIDRLDLDAFDLPPVVFAALGCGAQEATAGIEGLDQVVVSHDNCPHQSIICGEEASVAAALDRLRARGVMGQVLPFRSGFHSPMLKLYLGPMREAVARLPLQRPVVPVWSATTVAPFPDSPDEVREVVIRHLVEPVRFRALTERLYEEGARVFVQVGTGSLTGFLDDTLRGRDHLAVTANTPQRSGLDQLRRVAAALWAEGLAPRFDRLPSGRPAPQPTGRAVRYDLGAPLARLPAVRFPDPAGQLPPAVASGARRTNGSGSAADVLAVATPDLPQAASHPVAAEFEAALHDATATARAVLEAWQGSELTGPVPRQAVTTRVLSVETMPYLLDHCFFRQPEGWPDTSDRYPVVPMATLLELMVDAARALVPGRTVVGVDGVRALRWLAVAPPVTVTITARTDGFDRVGVTIDGYARATVVLADDRPAPPAPAAGPLNHERAPEITARQMYDERRMFHGPRFQGVVELGPIADDGIRGVLESLPAPGALLDNAGQLMGFWIMTHATIDQLAFPTAIDRVRLYGPHPRIGERVGCTVWIRSVTDTAVAADMELRTCDGRVWARIDGWEAHRFTTDDVVWPVLCHPERRSIAEEQRGGWLLARERWDSPTRELIMRRYLGAAERSEYERRSPRVRRQWLLGRIAVKDAVRRWLWDHGAGPVFPAEVAVSNDERG
ncbi:MAG: beta-ketoacyl synthase N-terminal-like domain-containing protein, partial [Egibacteraceae bacterium]